MTRAPDPHNDFCSLQVRLVAAEAARDRAQSELREVLRERLEQAGFLQALSRRLLQVQERERRRLACDLHDELGAILTRLRFALDPAGDIGGDPALLVEARLLVDELLARVRILAFDLRPAQLDHFGLVPALQWLFERVTSSTGLMIDFGHAETTARFLPETETAAYRIVQEAVTNAARHSGVERVVVRVWSDGGHLLLQIEDEGVGFDWDAVRAGADTVGFDGMIERVELLGGSLTIDAAPGEGTRILAALPVREEVGRRIDEHLRRLGG